MKMQVINIVIDTYKNMPPHDVEKQNDRVLREISNRFKKAYKKSRFPQLERTLRLPK